MTEELRITKVEREAGERLAAILALPMPEGRDFIGCDGEFDPWKVFPALYGSYCSDFDVCAVEVLCEIRDGEKKRHDLGAEMLREMLCVSNLCSYGTSPRVCFPTQQFSELLPSLIDKWRIYAALQWGDGWYEDTTPAHTESNT